MSEQSALILSEHEQSLQLPHQETEFAHAAAKQLMAIVRQNGWARKFGGQSEHLQVEAWLTVGKYYNLSVDTDQQEVEYVDYGGVWGFKAHAQVIDTKTGMRIGGASALCMSDEANWKSKPKFQLASMAQTRATSKALRQILSFVVALAGFSPTPYEEMVEPGSSRGSARNDSQTAIKEMREAKRAEIDDTPDITADWGGKSDEELASLDDVITDDEGNPLCRECKKKLSERELQFSQILCYKHQKES